MDINFEYYKIFYYVAKYKNITKAAGVLKSTQPKVTRVIKLLESQLNCALFIREPRGLKLTEEGKRLYEHVEVACHHLFNAEAELSSLGEGLGGTIEIGVTETALHLYLMDKICEFKKEGTLKDKVHCIITDIEMPIMDGHRLTKLAKTDDDVKGIPLIIFSSLVNEEMRRKGESLGADAQLTKPEIGNLVEAIDKLIDSHLNA